MTAHLSVRAYSPPMRRVFLLLVTLVSISMAAVPSSRVAGRVMFDNAPLPGCTVRLQSATMSRTVVTDVEGRYAFPGVAEGEYEIDFELDGLKPAQQRVLVRDEPVVVPVQELESAEIVLACGYCIDEPPADPYGPPLCSDDRMNSTLIESAEKGDASAVELLRSRFETADTYGQRHLIARTLLRRTSNDAKFWNELISYAEIAVRFPRVNDELSPEYLEWCAERGLVGEQHWDVASHALELSAADPRSHPLLLRALATNDITLLFAALEGLAKQQDFDSLSLIDEALARMPEDERAMLATMLIYFADERADAVAMKYLDPDGSAVYQQQRSEMRRTEGKPR